MAVLGQIFPGRSWKRPCICGHAEISCCGESGTRGDPEACAGVCTLLRQNVACLASVCNAPMCCMRSRLVCFGWFVQPRTFLQAWLLGLRENFPQVFLDINTDVFPAH